MEGWQKIIWFVFMFKHFKNLTLTFQSTVDLLIWSLFAELIKLGVIPLGESYA